MKKYLMLLGLIIFLANTAYASNELFAERLASIKQAQEVENGYVVIVDLELFNDNPANIEVYFNDPTINIIGHYQNVDTNVFGSVTKTFNPLKPVDTRKISKEKIDNEVRIFIPFKADSNEENSNSVTYENELLKAKNNFDQTLQDGIFYTSVTYRGDEVIRVKTYQKGTNIRVEFEDGEYMITGERDENGKKVIIWYSSNDNIFNIHTLEDNEKFENVYIDKPENYNLYTKVEEINTYPMSCTKYNKSDVNGEINVCINIDSGIIFFEEKVGMYKKELIEFSIGNIPENIFDIPADAEINNISGI